MELLDNFFWVPFAVVAAIVLFRVLKHGGLRGALYGSAVAKTIGEIELGRKIGTTMTLRVHVLKDGQIVVEQASRAPLGASLTGIPLNSAQTDQLIALLQRARA